MTTSVLFICDNNAIFGPMAEAFMKRHGWSAFTAYSAGILAKPIHRFTFRVMEEIGHDLYGYAAKSIFEFNHLERVDFLITLSDTVNEHYVFNENHIGCRLHWPFRNPLLEPSQAASFSIDDIPLFHPYLINADYWVLSSGTQLATQKKSTISLYSEAQNDVQDVLKRFRRTRDEMEVQVMNWLEEQGLGPLWWR